MKARLAEMEEEATKLRDTTQVRGRMRGRFVHRVSGLRGGGGLGVPRYAMQPLSPGTLTQPVPFAVLRSQTACSAARACGCAACT